jgi:hypothetical protein
MGPFLSPGCLGVVSVAMSGGAGLDGDAGDPPLEDAVCGSHGESVGVQEADGVVGEDAVAAAAVGDDLLVVRELYQPLAELLEGDVDGAGQVAAGGR